MKGFFNADEIDKEEKQLKEGNEETLAGEDDLQDGEARGGMGMMA